MLKINNPRLREAVDLYAYAHECATSFWYRTNLEAAKTVALRAARRCVFSANDQRTYDRLMEAIHQNLLYGRRGQ